MKIDLINKTEHEINFAPFDDIFRLMIKDNIFEKEDWCCLQIVNDKEIQTLNHKYRGRNETTDVLSFPSDCIYESFRGDIVINIDSVEKMPTVIRTMENDNESDGYSTEEKPTYCHLLALFIHGLLHLLNMDHISKKDKERMTFLEAKYLKLIKWG